MHVTQASDAPYQGTKQAAEELFSEAHWVVDDLLDERNRGKVSGLPRLAHETIYPKSYEQMQNDPLHWVPPGGESIISVSERATRLISKLERCESAILSAHRDWIWGSLVTLEGLSESALADINTDAIENGQIIHYTSINPRTGKSDRGLVWKRIVNPWASEADIKEASNTWIEIPNKAKSEQTRSLLPVECAVTRSAIRDSMVRIVRTKHILGEEDEGYDIQQESLSGEVVNAESAFDCKPDGCEMQCNGDDNYYCERCDFEASMDPLQP